MPSLWTEANPPDRGQPNLVQKPRSWVTLCLAPSGCCATPRECRQSYRRSMGELQDRRAGPE
eukprot:7771309-Prorocentrum_lima.AAC.1